MCLVFLPNLAVELQISSLEANKGTFIGRSEFYDVNAVLYNICHHTARKRFTLTNQMRKLYIAL